MMVTFVSQCEKKALNRTRRVLDAFADRIGDNTWQTVITQEGLNAVKKLLRKTASKNTAVSCHWIRSRSRTELVWVVGNKRQFNTRGTVPVNTTSKANNFRDDQADWHYLPLIQSLASLAALLHDWGKASARFQEKLDQTYKGKQGDALRHEWVSCLLLKALVSGTDTDHDIGWLSLLAEGQIDESRLKQIDQQHNTRPLRELPPTAKLVAWLILTHHRMPLQRLKARELLNEWKGKEANSMDDLFLHICQDWGYWNDSASETLANCLQFPNGLVTNSKPWVKAIKRWARKLLDQQPLVDSLTEKDCYRPILHHARLCLMLADHYYSSLTLEESGSWHQDIGLIANTQKDGAPKQTLDQHLVGVYGQAKCNAQKLPQLERRLPVTNDIAALRKKSPHAFQWQDKAAAKVRDWTALHKDQKHGFFAVNMASTGCGKTFANAKVMLALSENNDSLRYILALGLRTLTLQTGDEYRERIFQQSGGEDLAVLIGSKAIAELHNKERVDNPIEGQHEEKGSESQESLLGATEDIYYDTDIPEDGLATLLPHDKARKLLFAPILVCTIDHIMAATETTRGGRYILPCLRLMSSDLVIDEIDDFTGADAIAIGRLIHMAAMLGRKVMISSATIPPALAEGYFNCYREGWHLFAATRSASQHIGCAWIDEFNTSVIDNSEVERNLANQAYAHAHQTFINKRVVKLAKQAPKRKADIIDCQSVIEQQGADSENKQSAYFHVIAEAALTKHRQHYHTDSKTGLNVSFGVIRTANIAPCIALTRFFLEFDCPANVALRILPYHSQQVLLLRHEQERHLDAVLKRKEKLGQEPVAFENAVIRQHLDNLARRRNAPTDILFILVATPVEEVGRDHDFDWAIVEPSSYRSIIQLAGRVRRHRAGEVATPNIGLLQYNWKTVKTGDKKLACYFSRPGYEFDGDIEFNGGVCKAACVTHDLKQLVNASSIAERLDAIPRIDANPPDGFGLANLEHIVTSHWLKRYHSKGPETLQGYLSQYWYLTALSQVLNRFRDSESSIQLYLFLQKSTGLCFLQKDEKGWLIRDSVYQEPCNMASNHNISQFSLTQRQQERLWLSRDYKQILSIQAEQSGISLLNAALRYGELLFREPREYQSAPSYLYNDNLGLFKEERR